jgi:hypothetical protein
MNILLPQEVAFCPLLPSVAFSWYKVILNYCLRLCAIALVAPALILVPRESMELSSFFQSLQKATRSLGAPSSTPWHPPPQDGLSPLPFPLPSPSGQELSIEKAREGPRPMLLH